MEENLKLNRKNIEMCFVFPFLFVSQRIENKELYMLRTYLSNKK